MINENKEKFKVLVTGASGQLGLSLRKVITATSAPQHEYTFLDSSELDVTSKEKVTTIFQEQNFDFCINCAAYTAVDLAEENKSDAFLINAEAVKNLIDSCNESNCTLIHISTDFVFDGKKGAAYNEEDSTGALNVYGASKAAGEKYIEHYASRYFIVRTSWVFSEYGKNFFKKMLEIAETKDVIEVVEDQIGSPTYAVDLAVLLLKLVTNADFIDNGIYHFCNSGITTWHAFAKEIFRKSALNIEIRAISSKKLNAKADRPNQSVLDCSKIEQVLSITRRSWQEALGECLQRV